MEDRPYKLVNAYRRADGKIFTAHDKFVHPEWTGVQVKKYDDATPAPAVLAPVAVEVIEPDTPATPAAPPVVEPETPAAPPMGAAPDPGALTLEPGTELPQTLDPVKVPPAVVEPETPGQPSAPPAADAPLTEAGLSELTNDDLKALADLRFQAKMPSNLRTKNSMVAFILSRQQAAALG